MVVMQRPFRNRETNFCSIIYSVSSTDPENSAKIGPIDFEVCQESLKKKQKLNIQPAVPAFSSRARQITAVKCYVLRQ